MIYYPLRLTQRMVMFQVRRTGQLQAYLLEQLAYWMPAPRRQPADRIITHNGSIGTPFQWADLTTAQKADLKTEPNASIGADAKAQARLDFLRGDRTNEQGNGGSYTFRARSKLLGDIVDSDPVFVGKPRSAWPNTAPFPTGSGQTYSDFSAANLSRAEMVYVGANDGMLHGFKASDGSEAIAYIPGTLYSSSDATSGLHYLTDPAYTHRFYVDMPSTVEDAYFNTGSGAAWHTVLIGGERSGGKGIFALTSRILLYFQKLMQLK